jgi:uncharacterized protein YjbI with pentapeptide repeats
MSHAKSSAFVIQSSVLMHCYLARSMQGSSLKSGNFAGATMLGVDLRNANMKGINLKGAQLGGTPGVGSRRRDVPYETYLDGADMDSEYVLVTINNAEGEMEGENELYLDTAKATPRQIKVLYAPYLGM